MKNFIYNEMMVHVPLCTNKNPQNILIISDNADELVSEVKKHNSMACESIACSLDELSKKADTSYDVVISEMSGDALSISQINRVLKDDGLVVTNIDSLEDVEKSKELISTLGKYAKIVMPYRVSEGKMALLASKEYHPTADIILQRSDMLDGLEYYNCDVHIGSFAMGNYIRKNYLGIIKN